ncbi:MAG: transporter substrate-binding domain-containing protein [bacterium]
MSSIRARRSLVGLLVMALALLLASDVAWARKRRRKSRRAEAAGTADPKAEAKGEKKADGRTDAMAAPAQGMAPAGSGAPAAPAAPAEAARKVDRDRVLIIGTKPAPPFSMQDPEGNWQGISIQLWRGIAQELKLKFKFKKQTLEQLITETKSRKLDAAVAALTITAAREKQIDFTHPFYTSGLGIAVQTKEKSGAWQFFKRIFSLGFIKVLLALLGLLTLVGMVVWLFERKRNHEQFGGSVPQGLGNGLWFSAVTMTTVGYGDKAPVTLGGRLVGLLWMFASIIIISSFTASITTTLTVSRLESSIQSPKDLANKKVGTVPNSTSAAYLKREGIAVKYYKDVLASLQGVAKGEVDAAVYDAPIMQYLAKSKLRGKVRVLPIIFERQDYGIALPNQSGLREEINRVLLQKLTHSSWRELKRRYLGD